MTTETTPAPEFKPGDKVSFTHVFQNGRSMSFSTREGKILTVDGETVLVQKRNGRKERFFLSELRHVGQKTALTEAFENMAETCNSQPS